MITRGIPLTYKFVKAIETTSDLVVYKLGSIKTLPSNLVFPAAKTATLINCDRTGVFNILTENAFPSLERIHYLSTHPSDFNIHKRFKTNPKVQWVFPEKEYAFYTYILNLGKGHRDPTLLSKYLKNKRIIDGAGDFDISYLFDIQVPGLGCVEGEWYRNQFHEYCVQKRNELLESEEY